MSRERRRARSDEARPIAEVNMTPLMDLTFLLLITFIIAFPAIQQGINIKLPKGKTDKVDQKKSQTISVQYPGTVYFNDKEISPEDLEAQLQKLNEESPDTPVLVKCDERVEYKELMKTLRILHKYKITKMALITDPN